MPLRLFSTRSISTAAFYTARSAHPRRWSKGRTWFALDPFQVFLSEMGRLTHFSLLLPTPVVLPAPGIFIEYIRTGERSSPLPATVHRLASPPFPGQAPKGQRKALHPPRQFFTPFRRGHSCNAAENPREALGHRHGVTAGINEFINLSPSKTLSERSAANPSNLCGGGSPTSPPASAHLHVCQKRRALRTSRATRTQRDRTPSENALVGKHTY